MKKVIIIGAGPAGITAGIYLTRAKIDNIVITNNSGSLKKAELVENYYGFENPISGSDLINNGINQYKRLGGNLIEDEIVSLTYEDKLKVIGVKDSYYCDIVIIATGAGRLMPNIKGLKEEKGVSFCAICDAFFYRDKDVCVIGNGNYAAHEAETLKQTSKSVVVLTNGKENNVNKDLNINTNEISFIEKNDEKFMIHFIGNDKLIVDGIFIAEGVANATALAKKIGIRIDNNKILVDENKKTIMPNIYAIGDCTGGILQISKAVYDGMVAALNIIKENK